MQNKRTRSPAYQSDSQFSRPRVETFHGAPSAGVADASEQISGSLIEADAGAWNDSTGVIMACVSNGCKVGIAVYERLTNSISVTQVHDEVKGPMAHQMLQLAKLQSSPDVIYISTNSEAHWFEACQSPISDAIGFTDGKDDHSSKQSMVYCVRKERSSLFNYEKALSRIEGLNVTGMPLGISQREQMQLINTMISLSDKQQVSVLGALISIVQKVYPPRREGGQTEDVSGSQRQNSQNTARMHSREGPAALPHTLSLASLSEIQLHGYLVVDPVSLRALQIFSDQRHPSSMGIGVTKEGFSLFGQMQRCVSNMGRRLMRVWFLRPVVNLAVIMDRQDTVALLVKAPEVVMACRDVMKKVHDIPMLLQRLEKAQVKPGSGCFQQLLSSLTSLLAVRDLFWQLAPNLVTQGSKLATDQDSWQSEGTDQSAPVSLGGWETVSITHKVNQHITDELIACHNLIDEVIDFDEAEGMMIQSGVCQQLDEMKEVYHNFPDFLTQASLCSELIKRVMKVFPQLHRAAAVVAELDCLCCFALCAREGNYCRPELTPENVLHIQDGRHPLTETSVDVYIPNDTHMDTAANRVHLVTGKSCYSKQVALIVFMAHLGAFVPATAATIGVVDRIFTRLVCSMLLKATARSLMILDEFGKGTLTSDGVGLMSACLSSFSTCRQGMLAFFTMDVLSTSHDCPVPGASLSPAGDAKEQHQHQQQARPPPAPAPAGEAKEQHIFLYKLRPGYASPSFGLFCAEMCGVDAAVVQRAKTVLKALLANGPLEREASCSNAPKQLDLVEHLVKLDLSGAAPNVAGVLLSCLR
eukprot:gene10602-12268_t